MVAVAQINVIVTDIEKSRAFYELLGLTFQSRNRAGAGPAEAWVATNSNVTVVLHSPGFASWWDETAPQPQAGGSQVDFELESVEGLEEAFAALAEMGAGPVKPPTDMPWGQRFAIVRDPDGYRVGLKAWPQPQP